jgi:hypothetical protein
MEQCDFCSSPRVVRRFQCMDFNAESAHAGVIYDGTRSTEGPTNVIMASKSYWAACAECANFVDEENIDGLVIYAVTSFLSQGLTVSPQTAQHIRYTYRLFFKNRIRIAETS